MKGFRKKLAGLLVFAMVLGILTPGMTTTVKAADAPQIVSEVNLLDETITLESTSAAAIKYLALKDTEVKVNADHVSLSKTEERLSSKQRIGRQQNLSLLIFLGQVKPRLLRFSLRQSTRMIRCFHIRLLS